MTDVVKSELFSPWIKAYPITEPIIDVFIKTMDESIKTKIENAANTAVPFIIQNPSTSQNVVEQQASIIADQTDIKISSATQIKANILSKNLKQEITNIEIAKNEINNAIRLAEDSKITNLIGQLQSPKAEVRNAAAESLKSFGNKFSKTNANKLIAIMQHSNQRWVTSRSRIEGHHCTDYEYTSIRHYAAVALADMNSKYVTSDIAQEARRTQSESVTTERVTDPGWV